MPRFQRPPFADEDGVASMLFYEYLAWKWQVMKQGL